MTFIALYFAAGILPCVMAYCQIRQTIHRSFRYRPGKSLATALLFWLCWPAVAFILAWEAAYNLIRKDGEA